MESAAIATYAFANDTDHSLTITKITTSCGCTTAELDQMTYAPGEKGEIEATFTIGDRAGEQNKTIVVETDDPKESTVIFRLTVHVPKLVEITPQAPDAEARRGSGRQDHSPGD